MAAIKEISEGLLSLSNLAKNTGDIDFSKFLMKIHIWYLVNEDFLELNEVFDSIYGEQLETNIINCTSFDSEQNVRKNYLN